jgi:REP element-mobilizing transposase RayT
VIIRGAVSPDHIHMLLSVSMKLKPEEEAPADSRPKARWAR